MLLTKHLTFSLVGFFRLFNTVFGWIETAYGNFINALTNVKSLIMIIFVAGLAATAFMYTVIPSGFIPEEDQGYFFYYW